MAVLDHMVVAETSSKARVRGRWGKRATDAAANRNTEPAAAAPNSEGVNTTNGNGTIKKTTLSSHSHDQQEQKPNVVQSQARQGQRHNSSSGQSVGALYANELFASNFAHEQEQMYTAANRQSLANLCATSTVQLPSKRIQQIEHEKFLRDASFLDHSCIYIPSFLQTQAANSSCSRSSTSSSCGTASSMIANGATTSTTCSSSSTWTKTSGGGTSLFNLLMRELGPLFQDSPFRRSRHPAVVDPKLLEEHSPTYVFIRDELVRKRFPSLRVGYSIANLYRSGKDSTDMHRDHFSKAEDKDKVALSVGEESSVSVGEESRNTDSTNTTKRKEARPVPNKQQDEDHNVTIGISLGATRTLAFKHLKTGRSFSFPQNDGDLFAFTTPVNSAFQHAIPLEPHVAGPRISLIFWGRVEDEKLM
ncbi:unnamed protein product [Amoebophrya sp. A25]|nr:unnamed protein product [Amoebophrya sp. A25]|eukprot:GSA25T00026653001.1